ncbi:DNA repair protein RecO [uncultured Anaerococcus sp.]|uniref:DNA repair protein RecO n=1 Tax=uncultured Anaerococcus sp. TaxID=293428 RepID=UPI00288952BF|nr:DNA repair protein RecO [uncultured Anaerococcus sp.]
MATADLKDIRGIVLREFKYKESSKIIEVFTKDMGKISINCQGVLKKNSKNLALTNRFILASFDLYRSGKDFYGLREGLVLNPYYKSNKNFDIILYKSAICDLLLRTIDHIQVDTVFTLLTNSFDAFEKAEKNYINIFLGFFLKYISFSGFKPNFKTCGICGKNIRGKYLYFSPSESSVICDECKDQVFDKVFMTYEEFVYFNKLLYTRSEDLEDINLVENYPKIGKIIIDYCLSNLDLGTYPSLEWVKKALERNVNVL